MPLTVRRLAADEDAILALLARVYEIGVRAAHRRRGVGRALVAAMDAHMRAHHIREVWVLADNDDAIAFYRACGFIVPDGQATYMTRD